MVEICAAIRDHPKNSCLYRKQHHLLVAEIDRANPVDIEDHQAALFLASLRFRAQRSRLKMTRSLWGQYTKLRRQLESDNYWLKLNNERHAIVRRKMAEDEAVMRLMTHENEVVGERLDAFDLKELRGRISEGS